ncbi:MAG: lipid-A-disaccharide synthase N-terminal domain-containing protein [Acidobacteriia bacterium]|nr:lipid-A-disaccharide synthase N-terminal domain-containing protein [Terriglobia bacterium]
MTLDRIPTGWLLLGLVGQAAFSARFVIQWLASERRRRSVVPSSFWWLSLAGGALLLAYALHRRDPVFVLGQSAGLAVYLRNLALIRKRPPEDAKV